MSYRVITEVRFTDQFNKLTPDEQMAEQVAALELVTRNGGTIADILVVPGDQLALTVAEYPDEAASMKAHLQIQARGSYTLNPKRTFTLDEWTAIVEAARQETVVGV
jgi:uncharacterized protein with GYD domain